MQVAEGIIKRGHGTLVVEACAGRFDHRRSLIQFGLVQLDDAAEAGIVPSLRQVQSDIRLIHQGAG